MTNTINIIFELLDNISDKWKEEKIFVYGQVEDGYEHLANSFEDNEGVFGIRAKSEEGGKILLHFQSTIIEGWKSAMISDEKIIAYHYGDMTMKEIKDYILENAVYEIHTFNSGEKIIFDIKAHEGPDWIEQYYTGDSKEFLRSYNINMEQSEVEIWDMKKIKKELNSIR